MRTRLLTLALVVGAGAANAQQDANARLAYRLPGMEAAVRTGNLVYRSLTGSADTSAYGTALLYDVYRPVDQGTTRRPGVVFIHGGVVAGSRNQRPKDWPQYQEWGRLAAAAGLVGITFTHRMTTDDNADIVSGDIDSLLATVRARASDHGLDPDRLCIAVFSAGGPLAAPFLRNPRPYVRCLVLFYPYLDMVHAGTFSPFRQPHGTARLLELAPYSPTRWLLANADRVPPIFLARAGRDAIPGLNGSIERFVSAALLTEAPLDFYIHSTGAHGFDMTTSPDARAAAIVEASVAFMLRHLRR